MGTAFLNYVFQGIPEMVALIFTAFAIAGYQAPRWKVLWFGVFLASLIWIIRLYEFPFGFHSLVLIVLMAIIIFREVKISMGKSFFIAFITSFLLLSLEITFHLIMEQVLGITFDQKGWVWVIAGWPQIFALVVVSLTIRKWSQRRLTRLKGIG